jgi:hypothetical protein
VAAYAAQSFEATRVHHASRQRSGSLAARSTRAAAGFLRAHLGALKLGRAVDGGQRPRESPGILGCRGFVDYSPLIIMRGRKRAPLVVIQRSLTVGVCARLLIRHKKLARIRPRPVGSWNALRGVGETPPARFHAPPLGHTPRHQANRASEIVVERRMRREEERSGLNGEFGTGAPGGGSGRMEHT